MIEQSLCTHHWVKRGVPDVGTVMRCFHCNILHCNALWPSRSKGHIAIGAMDTEHLVNALGSLDRYRPTLSYMRDAMTFELDLRIARGDTVKVPYARKVRGIMGLKPGDVVNVTTRHGKVDSVRKLVVEKTMTKDEAVALKHEWLGDYAELELRTLAHAIDGLFTPDGLLSDDVARRLPSGAWKFPRHIIVMGVNERLAALDKRVKMLEAERGPGIKHEPDTPLPCDNGWDD